MRVAVCPHDSSKNKAAWLYFITYLSKKTGLELTMEQCFDFGCYYKILAQADLTYSSPLDALRVHEEGGFIPVAGNDNYDEVVIVAHKDAQEDLEALKGKDVLGVENQFATYLGVKVLKDRGIEFNLITRDSWQVVVRDVAKGNSPYGFVYKDYWEQLSSLSKTGLKVLYESQERLSSHLVMLSPKLEDKREDILSALLKMKEDEEGVQVLEKINVGEWYPVESLDYLKEILRR